MFINDNYITTLDLSGLAGEGSVVLASGFYSNSGIKGKSTQFENFTVRERKPLYGPVSGELKHDPGDDLVPWKPSGVWLTNMELEATFYNPYSQSVKAWNYGFFVRVGHESNVRFVVTSRAHWEVIGWTEEEHKTLGADRFQAAFNTNTGSNESSTSCRRREERRVLRKWQSCGCGGSGRFHRSGRRCGWYRVL